MILVLLILLVLDGAYLYSTRRFSAEMIRRMQGGEKTPMRILGIVVTYACIAALVYWFILRPKRSVVEAFLLGLCVYGVYDGTNYAIFKHYPLSFAVMDTVWGGILFALTTYLARKLKLN